MKRRTEQLLWERSVLLVYSGLCSTRKLKLARCLTGIMFGGAEVLIFCIMFTDRPKLLFEIFRLCYRPAFCLLNNISLVPMYSLWRVLHFQVRCSVASVDSTGFEFCLRNTLPTRNGARFGLPFGNAEWQKWRLNIQANQFSVGFDCAFILMNI